MRRAAALITAILLLFSGAAAEEMTQKAPDFILEGYDGEVSGRNWDTNLFFARLQEMTGVSFQFTQHSDADRWKERKGEIAEGLNLPDVLFKANLTPDETRSLYETGRIIDLAPYLEEYAPDLWKLLEEHPDWKAAITMEDGAIPALPQFNTLQNNDGMWINSQWLRRVGKEIPATAEELTEVLRAFKEKDPNGNGQTDEVPLTFIGMWELRFLAHAFGIIDNDYYVCAEDGQVVSHLTSDQNRAFLTWLNSLWQEGLLDPNGFASTESTRQITDEKKVPPYGLIMSYSPLTVVPQNAMGQYTLMAPLTYEGKQIYRDLTGDVIRGTFAVTSACAEPEKMAAWVNNFYTEEISRLAYYGQEGEDYIVHEDGLWEWSMDPDTVTNVTLPESTLNSGGSAPGVVDTAFQMLYSDEETRSLVEQMAVLKQFAVYPFPLVTPEREDRERIAQIQRDLSDYVENALAAFVAGDVPLDDEHWDLFCRTAEEKGLTEMISIWQKYLR